MTVLNMHMSKCKHTRMHLCSRKLVNFLNMMPAIGVAMIDSSWPWRGLMWWRTSLVLLICMALNRCLRHMHGIYTCMHALNKENLHNVAMHVGECM